MPDPVKLSLLKAIEAAIGTVTQIAEVHRDDEAPTLDRDTASFPVAFIFNDRETVNRNNRYLFGEFPLHIEVWITGGTTPLADQAEIIEAEVRKVMFSDDDVLYWSMKVKEESADKLYTGEGYLALILMYTVTYAHKWGDPYDPAKNAG